MRFFLFWVFGDIVVKEIVVFVFLEFTVRYRSVGILVSVRSF